MSSYWLTRCDIDVDNDCYREAQEAVRMMKESKINRPGIYLIIKNLDRNYDATIKVSLFNLFFSGMFINFLGQPWFIQVFTCY